MGSTGQFYIKGAKNHWYSSFHLLLPKKLPCGREKGSEGRSAPGYFIQEDGKKVSDEQIKEFLMEEIEGDGFNYGYRKLTKVLRRKYKLIINKKKVCHLCKELGILRTQRQKNFHTLGI